MRSAILAITAVVLFSSVGCHRHNICQSCDSCSGGHGGHGGYATAGNDGPAHVGRLPHGYMQDAGPIGPPSAAYAYPYYTTRAPRDFLQDNPMSIGP